ncbi:hypothetical protein CcrColossus_gp427 [Caulobacter phage CcrColossus]|uniref:Uncharacterized protein n=1 Tax=Caulobacter phage CcrColossus TaxID=1211640 RepID=K4K6S9_9CAUD|nr:hypothetical protein CcrColossus_gp427 [Caulobacter phage CcrColossus]AFU88297.1 hypothetical protein CcrColossus_gp427 [Caulobacter phage CcrColossus]
MKLYPNHADMLAAIAEARAAALVEARHSVGRRGVYQSRGTWAMTSDGRERAGPLVESVPGDDWKTKWKFDVLIATIEAHHPEVTEIYVEGGFDYAESPHAMQQGDYDPEVSTWSLLVWKREQ